MKERRKIIIVLIFATILLLSAVIGERFQRRLAIRDFDKFDSASINGRIEYVELRRHGAAIKLLSFDNVYVFYPYTDPILNNSNIFTHFAKMNDSIVKKSFSDTLYLYKDTKMYKYLFKKFD